MCARRFLILVFILTLLVVAGAFAIFQFGERVLIQSATPKGHFTAPPPRSGPDYARCGELAGAARAGRRSVALAARPASPPPSRRARAASSTSTRPPISSATAGTRRSTGTPDSDCAPRCSCRARRARSTTRGEIWAPRYRQAAFGAFLLDSEDATRGARPRLSRRRAAFDQFLAQIPPSAPIILAGHSQGALHLMRLLRERVAGKPLRARIVAAYVVGWPISVTADLPALGLPACTRARPGRLPAVVDELRRAGQSRAGPRRLRRLGRARPAASASASDILCVNPLTGTQDGAAPPAANPGHAGPDAPTCARRRSQPGRVGARCDKGLLMIDGDDPAARALRAAGQQLPRLRLCLVLGRDPRRCGAEGGGVAAR